MSQQIFQLLNYSTIFIFDLTIFFSLNRLKIFNAYDTEIEGADDSLSSKYENQFENIPPGDEKTNTKIQKSLTSELF